MRLWLREYRENAVLSQKEIAKRIGVSHQFYNYIENGSRRPSPATAQKIASVLNSPWTRFYEDGSK